MLSLSQLHKKNYEALRFVELYSKFGKYDEGEEEEVKL